MLSTGLIIFCVTFCTGILADNNETAYNEEYAIVADKLTKHIDEIIRVASNNNSIKELTLDLINIFKSLNETMITNRTKEFLIDVFNFTFTQTNITGFFANDGMNCTQNIQHGVADCEGTFGEKSKYRKSNDTTNSTMTYETIYDFLILGFGSVNETNENSFLNVQCAKSSKQRTCIKKLLNNNCNEFAKNYVISILDYIPIAAKCKEEPSQNSAYAGYISVVTMAATVGSLLLLS